MPRVIELWTGHIEGEFVRQGKRVQRDAIWGGAVVEGESFAPAGARWRYVSFFCARGQNPRVLAKPMSSERAATDMWRSISADKRAEGYREVDWRNQRYGMEMTVRELGTLPGEIDDMPSPHPFTYGSSVGGTPYCRVCGQEEATMAHGFTNMPEPVVARPKPRTSPPPRQTSPPKSPTAPKPAAVEPEQPAEIPDLARRRGRRETAF